MNEALENFLDEISARTINPIWDSVHQMEIVGWHCKMPNLIGYRKNITKLQRWLEKNKSQCTVTELTNGTGFFIYENNL